MPDTTPQAPIVTPLAPPALPVSGNPPNKSLGVGAVASPGYGFAAITQRGQR